MHVTACLAGQNEEVEVGEDCRSLQALQEAIVKALPQLCVEGFDVSVGGRALDSDDGVVSLEEAVCLDVVPNTRGLSVLALREAGREVSEAGLLQAAKQGDVGLCTLYLDAGVPIDCVDDDDDATPLLRACLHGHLSIATLLLDRGSSTIDKKNDEGCTPLCYACLEGYLEIATLLLDRGSDAIDEKDNDGETPLLNACYLGDVEIATLLLDRGSTAIDEASDADITPLSRACRLGHLELAAFLLGRGSNALDKEEADGETPLRAACVNGNLAMVTLLLDRGCSVDVEEYRRTSGSYPQAALKLLSERGYDVLLDDSGRSETTQEGGTKNQDL